MADQPDEVTPPETASASPPQPVQINSTPIIAIGTLLWLAGFLVLLPFYGTLGRHHHRIWLWTCLAGSLLGLAGYLLTRKHRGEGRTI